MLAALPPCPTSGGAERVSLPSRSDAGDRQMALPKNEYAAAIQREAEQDHSHLWNADDAKNQSWPRLRISQIVVIMVLLVWQYAALSLPGTSSYHPVFGSIGYGFQHMDAAKWMFVFLPGVLLLFLFLAKHIVLGLDAVRKGKIDCRNSHEAGQFCRRLWNEPKSNKSLKTIAIMAILVCQYAVIAVAAGSNCSLHDLANVMAVLLPTVCLIAYLAATRLMSWTDKSQPAANWAKSPTVMMPELPPLDPPAEPVVVQPTVAAAQPARFFRWGEKPTPALVLKSPRERFTQLIGSLLGSALVAAIMSGVAVLFQGYFADVPICPEQFVWLWLVGVVGSWAVLIPSKLWEGHRGEPILRRFVMMVVGMGVGLAAFGAGEVLMVNLRPSTNLPDLIRDLPKYNLPASFFDSVNGRPLMMAYVACFGTLFVMIRWWLQADPLRKTRMSLLTLFVSFVVAGAVAQAWQFPQAWLPLAACTISAAVQLASPWDRASRRRR
jgi:hypothetical protein